MRRGARGRRGATRGGGGGAGRRRAHTQDERRGGLRATARGRHSRGGRGWVYLGGQTTVVCMASLGRRQHDEGMHGRSREPPCVCGSGAGGRRTKGASVGASGGSAKRDRVWRAQVQARPAPQRRANGATWRACDSPECIGIPDIIAESNLSSSVAPKLSRSATPPRSSSHLGPRTSKTRGSGPRARQLFSVRVSLRASSAIAPSIALLLR